MAHCKGEQDDWLTVSLKYLLFVFNFFFWYLCLLLVIFLVELVAGVLAHVYYQRLSDELKQHLNRTLTESYGQPRAQEITAAVDLLQQDFKCCGSNSSADWQHSAYVLSREAEGRRVPDSCCKTVVARCGQRAHPSNIYKVEGGCITKLEQFLADHLLLMGAVGLGVACLQVSRALGRGGVCEV
ncbi:Tetraspanin-11 [Tupaia chinensis]|uniref:Tetraspanin n=1 Tax=Tupaia chinensis TaxID=246437 RepID=L8Y2A5_TUPCH|nr:Tetraspanin-11 [Tupaia chinensis]